MNNLLDTQIEASPPKEWSRYQLDIFDFIRDQGDNLLVQAVAGSGKTTTIVEGMSYADGQPLFLAFNKSIATEIASRITRGEAKTLNALGHRIVMQNWPKAQLNANRVRDSVSDGLKILPRDNPLRETGYAITRAISLAKANAYGLEGMPPVEPQIFGELIDAYDLGVPADTLDAAGEIAYGVWKALRGDSLTFDFDDQLYLPLYHEWEFPQPGCLFVDEAQDLSPVQHGMLAAIPGARIISVGDRFQAIYGFRGAAVDSMDQMKRQFNMKELPLSISYRCAQSVVREAKKLVPHIEWRDGAPEGTVDSQVNILAAAEDEFISDPQYFDNSILVLSRTNAPLFKVIMAHVRARKPCRVLSNFLDSFQSWIRGFRKTNCRDLLPRLDAWYEKEREALKERGASKGRLAALRDKWETAKLLAGEFTTVEEMLGMLKSLSEGRTGPIFSTIHKAKGLEAERVYLLRPDLCSAPWVDPDSDQWQQEQNLLYVAITRAEREFTYGVPQ
jgi:ATP-dependent DNA helicase UvrD/PcrA